MHVLLVLDNLDFLKAKRTLFIRGVSLIRCWGPYTVTSFRLSFFLDFVPLGIITSLGARRQDGVWINPLFARYSDWYFQLGSSRGCFWSLQILSAFNEVFDSPIKPGWNSTKAPYCSILRRVIKCCYILTITTLNIHIALVYTIVPTLKRL